MTRAEEDQVLTLKKRTWSKAAKRKVRTAPVRDDMSSVPLDRQPLAKRLAYGLSLMALGQDGVYGENYE